MAPIAAKHGAHRRLNIKKLIPDAALKARARADHADPSPPYRTPMVPTMFSFAIRPVTDATAACQLPQPRGAKSHAIPFPIAASILFPICSSSSIPNAPSAHPNLDKNQRTTVEIRITVPAFFIKLHPLSHILRSTLPTVGQ